MAASVRIEDEAFSDPRIELLGTLAGYNRFEALGRLAHLWRTCTHKECYTLPDVMIMACLGDKGVDALIRSGLGERDGDGVRIRGTNGRIEWLRAKRDAAKAGGAANKQRIMSGSPVSTQRGAKRTQGGARGERNEPRGEPSGSPITSHAGAMLDPSGSPPIPTPVLKEIPSESCSEPVAPASDPKPVMTFPIVGPGDKEWSLITAKVSEYQGSYPTLDIVAALRAARQWCLDNPTKRKTARGMPKFCSTWLNTAQNRGQYQRVAANSAANGFRPVVIFDTQPPMGTEDR